MSALTPTEPPNTDPNTDPRAKARAKARERIVKRLTAIAVLAVVVAVIIIVLASLGAAMVLGTQKNLGPIAVFTYGVACLIGVAVFMVALFALIGHHGAGESHLHSSDTIDQLAAQLVDAIRQMMTRQAAVEEQLAALTHIQEHHGKQLQEILHAHQDHSSPGAGSGTANTVTRFDR